jgi:predicted amidohydrolase YtcJ
LGLRVRVCYAAAALLLLGGRNCLATGERPADWVLTDAPVDTPDPRPFVNMTRAVTRRLPGGHALNPSQAISIRDVIDAYTISGARFLGLEPVSGWIDVGKSADFIVLNQDILKLADEGRADDIRNTGVLET